MKKIFIFILLCTCFTDTYAQIGIKANNTPPIVSAQLEVQSTNKAFYPPRMTTLQKSNIPSPQAGAVVYDTDLSGLYFYNGSAWVSASGAALSLPYAVSQSLSSNLLSLTNSNLTTTSSTIVGSTIGKDNDVAGVEGNAVFLSPTGRSIGLKGYNASNNANGSGVYGLHDGAGKGVEGQSATGIGGYFTSPNGYALVTGTGNVGIGTNTPAEKLVVNGKIRSTLLAGTGTRNVLADVNGNLVATTTALVNSYCAYQFTSSDNSNLSRLIQFDSFRDAYGLSGNFTEFELPLNFPNGVTLTEETVNFLDNSPTSSIAFVIYRRANDDGNNVGSFDYYPAINITSSTFQNVTRTLNEVIDNDTYHYFMSVYPLNQTGSTFDSWKGTLMKVRSVKIKYKY